MHFSVSRRAFATALVAFSFGGAVVYAADDVIDAIIVGQEKVTFNVPVAFDSRARGYENISLWGKEHGIGTQSLTTYLRSADDFAWFRKGEHDGDNMKPGKDGTVAMVLDSGVLKVCGAQSEANAGTCTEPVGRIEGLGTVPAGAIMMWSGTEDKIPPGWRLADGSDPVGGIAIPNLRGRFIVGATDNAKFASGKSGGRNQVTLSVANMPEHTHGEAGPHSHKTAVSKYNGAMVAGTTPLYQVGQSIKLATTPADAHTHAPVGKGEAFDIVPEYYALAYIIYVGVK